MISCVGWVGSYPLSSLAPTPVEVELGCDNILCLFLFQVNQHSKINVVSEEELLMSDEDQVHSKYGNNVNKECSLSVQVQNNKSKESKVSPDSESWVCTDEVLVKSSAAFFSSNCLRFPQLDGSTYVKIVFNGLGGIKCEKKHHFNNCKFVQRLGRLLASIYFSQTLQKTIE